ncbi:MAG: hypothetical protein JXA38_04050 [Methanosarcinaceae archaeon]|nr:hypothetical protein [Methanosarcinaceae archaeon]
MSDIRDKVKDRLSIIDIVGDYITLTREGAVYKGSKPPVQNTGKSLIVYPNTDSFYDWKNKYGGDVLNAIAHFEDLDINEHFTEILRIAARKAGIEYQKQDLDVDKLREKQNIQTLYSNVAEFYHSNLTNELYELIFKKWGITKETVDSYKIGFAPVNNKRNSILEKTEGVDRKTLIKSGLVFNFDGRLVDFYNGRIVFPYWKNGKVVYFIARKVEVLTPENEYEKAKYKKLLTPKNRSYISEVAGNDYLYGEDSLKGSDYCIITEGVTDCITLLQNGYTSISPVTVGFRETDYPKLLSVARKLETVYVCNDDEIGKAGIKGALKTARFLNENNVYVKIVTLGRDEGQEKIDVAEFLRDKGKDKLDERIEESLELWEFVLNEINISSLKPVDKLRTAKKYCIDELSDMDQSERKTIIDYNVKDAFGFKSTDMASLIKDVEQAIKKNNDSKKEVVETSSTPDIDEAKEAIRKKAIDIMEHGEPVKFILDTFSTIHVGDEETAKTLLVSIGCQSVKNSEGIQPKVSGGSGKGKTHCCKAMLWLIPPKYAISTTLSDKVIYYMDIPEGSIIFSDDVNLNETMEGVIKRSTTNYQVGDTHTTLDGNRNVQSLTIPPRVSWWLTSVNDEQSIQYLNRTFGGDVNETEKQDKDVMNFQLKLAANGLDAYPLNEDILICREIIEEVKNHLFNVKIPYAEVIKWVDPSNRRNLNIFLDMIKAFAVFRFKQRVIEDNFLHAIIDDFDDASVLYSCRAENQGLKINNNERKLVKFLQERRAADTKEIQKALKISQGTVHNLLHGRKETDDSGLLGKTNMITCEDVTVDNGNGLRTKKYIYRYIGEDVFKTFENKVVYIENDDRNNYYNYYTTITRLSNNENNINRTIITDITDIKSINENNNNGNDDSPIFSSAYNTCNSCNSGNNEATATITSKNNDVIVVTDSENILFMDIKTFVGGRSDQRKLRANREYQKMAFAFCEAHRGVYTLAVVKPMIEKMAECGEI